MPNFIEQINNKIMKNKNLLNGEYITLPSTSANRKKLANKITEVGITINKHKNYAYRCDGESCARVCKLIEELNI